MDRFERMENLYKSYMKAQMSWKASSEICRDGDFDPMLFTAGLIPSGTVQADRLCLTWEDWDLVKEYASFIGLPIHSRPPYVVIIE